MLADGVETGFSHIHTTEGFAAPPANPNPLYPGWETRFHVRMRVY